MCFLLFSLFLFHPKPTDIVRNTDLVAYSSVDILDWHEE